MGVQFGGIEIIIPYNYDKLFIRWLGLEIPMVPSPIAMHVHHHFWAIADTAAVFKTDPPYLRLVHAGNRLDLEPSRLRHTPLLKPRTGERVPCQVSQPSNRFSSWLWCGSRINNR